ncbi:MAG: hypothetical protein RIR26_289 [Pseudomonadota bacterium]
MIFASPRRTGSGLWASVFLFGISLLSRAGATASEAPTEGAQVLKPCRKTGRLKADELQELLGQVSLSDTAVRSALVSLLNEPSNACRRGLEDWLSEIVDKPSSFKNNTGRHAAVMLGLLLELPVALKFVEREATGAGAPEWLSLLKQWDPAAYVEWLRKWVVQSGESLRNARGLSRSDVQLYGRTTMAEVNPPAEVKDASPLLLNLYLQNAAGRKLAAVEFSALNMHFVAVNAGARRLFRDSYVPLVRRQTADWLSTFRTERVWTQFQLLDLMGEVGGSEMVRELLWLSQNHTDAIVKNLASRVLDETLKVR